MPETKSGRATWLLLVALYVALRVPALANYSPTYDEAIYVAAGKHFATLRDPLAAAMLYHPPLAYHLTSLPLWFVDVPLAPWNPNGLASQVGLPALYESHSFAGAAVSPQTVLLLSRLPIVAVGLVGLVLAHRLGRRLAGERTGLLAAIAWAVHPDVVAQSVQATTDLVAAVAALFLAWAAIRHFDETTRTRRSHLLLGVACGVAALAKHTLLLPIAIVAVAAIGLLVVRARRGTTQPSGAAKRFVVAALAAFATLWAGYLFEFGPLAVRGGGHEHAATTARLLHVDETTAARWMETIPVPAPTYFRSVADAFLSKAHARHDTEWRAYLNGEWSDDGFLAYFPEALLVKTPLALLALMAAGLAGFAAVRRRAGLAADLCLALFALPFAAAVASRLNIGVRHLLPAVPFAMLLGCAAIAIAWESRPRVVVASLGLLAALLAVEWVANDFDPLPFANLAAGGPSKLHRRLADSNLEIGEDLWAVERWCEERRVASVLIHVHDSQGLYEYERARHPYLADRARPRIRTLRPEDQVAGAPLDDLLAVGESILVLPAGYPGLVDVEPLARVGRTRIYRLPR